MLIASFVCTLHAVSTLSDKKILTMNFYWTKKLINYLYSLCKICCMSYVVYCICVQKNQWRNPQDVHTTFFCQWIGQRLHGRLKLGWFYFYNLFFLCWLIKYEWVSVNIKLHSFLCGWPKSDYFHLSHFVWYRKKKFHIVIILVNL